MTYTKEEAFALGQLYKELEKVARKYGDLPDGLQGATDMHPGAIGVKEARQHTGLTAQQLADKLGVSLRQVQRWDAGDQLPPVRVAQRLADTLGCSINDLF